MRNRILTGAAGLIAAAGLTIAGFAATANAATPPANPSHHASCELDGRNIVQINDAGTKYNYPASFHSTAAGPGTQVISGWLRDGYEPVPLILPVHGVAFKAGRDCDVVFSVAYPATGVDAGTQGVRTFSGMLDHRHLAGAVSETGGEDLAAPFALLLPVS